MCTPEYTWERGQTGLWFLGGVLDASHVIQEVAGHYNVHVVSRRTNYPLVGTFSTLDEAKRQAELYKMMDS